MRPIKEIKRIAREQLNSRYRVPSGAFAIAGIIVAIIEIPFSMSISDNPTILQIVIPLVAEYLIMLIGQVLSAGVIRIHLNMTRGGHIRIRDMFDTFRYGFERYFGGAFFLSLLAFIAFIPFILGIVALNVFENFSHGFALSVVGFVITLIAILYVALTYNLVYFFLSDYAEMGPIKAAVESRRIMKHKRFKLLGLLLSFIGYDILIACSLGIASLWVNPYITESQTIFYLDATGELDHIPVRSYEQQFRGYENTTM